jgi:hypothetical protein
MQAVDFETFTTSLTNWFLPWLALTAQLPYQTASLLGNIESLGLALGSPALIMFSLSVTVFNHRWIHQSLDEIKAKIDTPKINSLAPHLSKAVDAAEYLLKEGQQAPLRCYEGNGWLSSLILTSQNLGWWKGVKRDLETSKQLVTLPLIAQLVFALVAYMLTIIEAVRATTLPSVTQMSSSGLWSWMVPVCWGWVFAGTQNKKGTVAEALERKDNPIRKSKDDGSFTNETSQHGIRASGGLNKPKLRLTMLRTNGHDHGQELDTLNPRDPVVDRAERGDSTYSSTSEAISPQVGNSNSAPSPSPRLNESQTPLRPAAPTRTERFSRERNPVAPCWCGLSVAGDEGREGPIFNYARFMTWWRVAETIRQSFDKTRRNIEITLRVDGTPQWIPKSEDNLSGTNLQMQNYCGLGDDRHEVHNAYPEFEQIDAKVWLRLLGAALVAILIQWGTTGPSIIAAYLTGTVGLGCTSGSYLLYGCLATTSWFILLLSVFLSHAAMLREQKIQNDAIAIGEPPNTANPKRSAVHKILNALWVIASTLMEYLGMFTGCWCDSGSLLGATEGWVTLFYTTQDGVQITSIINWYYRWVIFSFGAIMAPTLTFASHLVY